MYKLSGRLHIAGSIQLDKSLQDNSAHIAHNTNNTQSDTHYNPMQYIPHILPNSPDTNSYPHHNISQVHNNAYIARPSR